MMSGVNLTSLFADNAYAVLAIVMCWRSSLPRSPVVHYSTQPDLPEAFESAQLGHSGMRPRSRTRPMTGNTCRPTAGDTRFRQATK